MPTMENVTQSFSTKTYYQRTNCSTRIDSVLIRLDLFILASCGRNSRNDPVKLVLTLVDDAEFRSESELCETFLAQ